jgi:putative DNA primase/helicase
MVRETRMSADDELEDELRRLRAERATPIGTAHGFRSGSYLSAVTIIEGNVRDVLPLPLELNEMTGRVELGRVEIRDEHVSQLRAEIERKFIVGKDKQGNAIGLKLSMSDVHAAVAEVAYRKSYHPVRDYLAGLVWDRIERLNQVAEDILGAARSILNQAIIRRFFIGAVARAMKPGCKVDTMPILVGRQGALKSTFFKRLSDPWFLDTEIDISKKDAFEQIRQAWIVEWAELESLFRARDANSVKAFLSSARDTYRPSYGRNAITVERSCVIVGTTNSDEFLTDETGNRRFWPLRVGDIDVDLAEQQRDQLWAEAMHLFMAKEQWHLTATEEAELRAAHDDHRVRDVWESVTLDWGTSQVIQFTTGDVLEKAIKKPAGQWNRADEMRVARVLKANGWERKTDPSNKNSKKWAR